MPFDLNTAIENIRLALDRLPSALIAIALLGAPTAAWILYRALEVRRLGLAREEAPPEYWACGECGSLSRVGQEWCYRCGAAADAELGLDVGWTEEPEPIGPPAPVRRWAALRTWASRAGNAPKASVGVPVMKPAADDDGAGVPVMAETAAVAMTSEPGDRPRPVVIRATAKTVLGPGRAPTRRR